MKQPPQGRGKKYRYCTLSRRLMPGPYIFSSLSNSVVSSDRGGVSPFARDFRVLEVSFESIARDWSSSISSSLVELESSSTSCALASSFSAGGLNISLDGFRLPVLSLLGLVKFFFSLIFDRAFLSRFLFVERIVGGSCIGSPANINFLALKMGTQQTYPAHEDTKVSRKEATYSLHGLCCFIDNEDVELMVS